MIWQRDTRLFKSTRSSEFFYEQSGGVLAETIRAFWSDFTFSGFFADPVQKSFFFSLMGNTGLELRGCKGIGAAPVDYHEVKRPSSLWETVRLPLNRSKSAPWNRYRQSEDVGNSCLQSGPPRSRLSRKMSSCTPIAVPYSLLEPVPKRCVRDNAALFFEIGA